MLKKIVGWFKTRKESRKIQNWFSVSWDDVHIYIKVTPPGKKAWDDKLRWADIERICFECTDYMYSDDIYIITTERPESYIIPTEASGGIELWGLIIDKQLFDAELAIQAASSLEGMYCWPNSES